MPRLIPALLAIVTAITGHNTVSAQQRPSGAGRDEFSYSLSITPFHQPTVNIDGGGEFSLSSAFVRFRVERPVSRNAVVGLSLKYDADNYDFSGVTEFGGTDPWNNARRFGIGVPVFIRFANDWSLGFTPSVNWLQETGADSSQSVALGVPVFALKRIAEGRSLGFGAGLFRNVEDELDVFPFLAVNWRFNEKWSLSNPFEADVLGPAGLELTYAINEGWVLGVGGVYRSFRFRLDDEGVAPNGIGENQGIVGFAHLSWGSQAGFKVDAYTGATFNGKLELLNVDGDEIASSDYDSAVFIALRVGVDF